MSKWSLFLAALLMATVSVQADAKPGKKRKAGSSLHCNVAYKNAKNSASRGDVITAIETCETATEKVCAKNSDGTGDGRLVTALCGLKAAHEGYRAAVKGQTSISAKCGNAFKEASKSPSTGDVMDAIEVCEEETTLACQKQMEDAGGAQTGDGRLIGSLCGLEAAYGAYRGVTAKDSDSADANLCGGRKMPLICKGSCYVNYECRNNKWTVSPKEICRLCGDAANDAIDIFKGESGSSAQ